MKPLDGMVCKYGCNGCIAAAGNYVYKLSTHSIQPGTVEFTKKSFVQILGKASSFTVFDNTKVTYCNRDSCSCTSLKAEYISDKLRERFSKLEEAKVGICLDCLGTDGASFKERKCRDPHPALEDDLAIFGY